MEQTNNNRYNLLSRRSTRLNRHQAQSNIEQNYWIQLQESQEYMNEEQMQEIEQNMEMLEASARNTSTPIRPYYHPRRRLLRNHRTTHESNIQVTNNQLNEEEEEILIDNIEQQRSYFHDLRSQQRSNNRYLRQMIAQAEQQRNEINEEVSEIDEEQILAEVQIVSNFQQINESIQAKSIEEYKEFIPACWFEVLEKDNSTSVSIIESYGPLALLLYTRIMKLSRQVEEMRELRIIAVITAAQSNGARQGMDEIKFIQKILEFYNFNISLAKRDLKCKIRLQHLISIIPSFKQLQQVFNSFPPDDNEIVVYKVTLDLMERYYQDFDGPLYLTYRKQFLPFAEQFYNSLEKNHIELLKIHINYFRPYYNSNNKREQLLILNIGFLMYETPEQFQLHYEKKRLELDNLCREVNIDDCYM